ncbi:hypothetical protein KCP74_13705 [Salmonella enterica subsp. enterica]|nr:hypothetical protein KCP74_13705 [Salmonella enterica subsp. enterica]
MKICSCEVLQASSAKSDRIPPAHSNRSVLKYVRMIKLTLIARGRSKRLAFCVSTGGIWADGG